MFYLISAVMRVMTTRIAFRCAREAFLRWTGRQQREEHQYVLHAFRDACVMMKTHTKKNPGLVLVWNVNMHCHI